MRGPECGPECGPVRDLVRDLVRGCMRGACEFEGCPCPYFWRNASQQPCSQRCHWCGHGECWHERTATTFHSVRRAARRPVYVYKSDVFVFTPVQNATPVPPLVPPLPEHGYCDTIVALPV